MYNDSGSDGFEDCRYGGNGGDVAVIIIYAVKTIARGSNIEDGDTGVVGFRELGDNMVA